SMMINAIVALYTLRQHYHGNITFYVQPPCSCMEEFKKSLKHFDCNVVELKDKSEYKTLVMKNSLFENPPYDKTLWMDTDTVTVGKVEEMFEYLDEHDVDMCIPSFCGWVSDGHSISKRIKRFTGIIENKYIDKALKNYPAINTGVLSFRKSNKWAKFVKDWTKWAHQGALKRIFIPDETVAQAIYPSMDEWGLKYFIAPTDFNVSVLHDHGQSKDRRIIHFHGRKSVLDVETCNKYFKPVFRELREKNVANINTFVPYAHKRIKEYLKKESGEIIDTTIVTACDPYYVEILKHTFPNWQKYKHIDKYPVIVFVNGMDLNDKRLDFLRLPNVKLISWSKEKDLDEVTDHREEMLSAFVFGTAKYVKTDYWLKLDADSYATDDRPFITEKMKSYAFCGHKWGYSRPNHIKQMDKWAKGHWRRKLRKAPPMINEGRIEGRRFYHNTKRTISFVQLHKTKFSKFCVGLLKKRRMPIPSQDTFYFYVENRFDPHLVGIMNFKKNYGFTQGRGKMGSDWFENKMKEIDEQNSK
ncbi:MAG: hypothetical protein ACOCWG_04870, partial [bacterium]